MQRIVCAADGSEICCSGTERSLFMNELYVMGMITNRGIRSKMIPFFKEHHIHVTLSTMGVGTANSAILDYLGMEATEKTIYFAFVTMETWKSFKKELYSKMKIDIAGRGIAFLIPMSSIGGKAH